MKEEIARKLNEEFTRNQIKSRKGPSGKQLDYVEAHTVIARLNEALGLDWSFEIVEHRILDREIVVVGKLTVHGDPVVTKTAFGAQAIKRYEGSDEPVSLGDDLKAAASDALKKAATLLGVGLHLYDKSRVVNGSRVNGGGYPKPAYTNGSGGPVNGSAATKAGGLPRTGAPAPGYASDGNGGHAQVTPITIKEPDAPLSLAQMKAVFRVGKSMGMSNTVIKELVKQRFGKDAVDNLTKREASDLISSLQASR